MSTANPPINNRIAYLSSARLEHDVTRLNHSDVAGLRQSPQDLVQIRPSLWVCVRRAPTLSYGLPDAQASRFVAFRVDRHAGPQTELIQSGYIML